MTNRVDLWSAACLLALLFAAWPAAGAEHGKTYGARCARCHGPMGWGDEEQRVPAIAGLPAAYILRQIEAYRGNRREEERMHREAVSAGEDLSDVAGLIARMKPLRPVKEGPADLDQGRRVLRELCAECHGSAGEGLAERGAPPLTGFQAWYLTDQIRRFKEAGRKGGAGSLDADRMHAIAYKVISLEDAEDVAAFLATSRAAD